jgi:DNA-binding IclR family transcriptional regulator
VSTARPGERGRPLQDAKPNAMLADDETRARYSKSLEQGLAILRCFAAEPPWLGVADINNAVGCGRSTACRYMTTLVALGYLEQNASRKYRLAARAANVGIAAIASQPSTSARVVLDQVREETGHTASLGALEGGELLYLARARGFGPHQREIDLGILGLRMGYRVPAHCTAMGQLLLAHLPEPDQRELLKRLNLERHGPHSITSMTALRKELNRITADGLALSDQELADALISIATPVTDDTGAVVASVALEAHTATTTIKWLLRHGRPWLVWAAGELSANLGPGIVQEKGSS